jgi:hypothetical protein
VSPRHAVRDRILALDPVADAEEIYRLHTTVEFPWDVQRALELALFRTYAVPSIGELLDTTQEFARRTQKRYDDTGLLLSAPVVHGLDSAKGKEAIRRINAIHRQFDISQDDFLYVLSTFVVVPIRFVERWGWRPVTEHERIATHEYYKGLGRRMAIDDIPDSWQELADFGDAYEAKHFTRTRETRAVADATVALVASWARPLPEAALRPFLHALMDAPLRAAFGYPAAPAPIRVAVTAGLRARAAVERRMRPRSTPATFEDSRLVRTRAPYLLSELGPRAWDTRTSPSSRPAVRSGGTGPSSAG